VAIQIDFVEFVEFGNQVHYFFRRALTACVIEISSADGILDALHCGSFVFFYKILHFLFFLDSALIIIGNTHLFKFSTILYKEIPYIKRFFLEKSQTR
ncbi:MAG: hypothetical protein KDI92_14190, partial [Xanthomonadales bacterium]|nr:hypothetical protein [Xanthomonadales bacterium]